MIHTVIESSFFDDYITRGLVVNPIKIFMTIPGLKCVTKFRSELKEQNFYLAC